MVPGAPFSTPLAIAGSIVLATLLVIASAWDVRERRIPNRLVAVTAGAGLVFMVLDRSPLVGMGAALGGMAIGLALWLPLYILRMLGAGDVKLFAASAAWLGPVGALKAALLTAMAGGVAALVLLVAQHGVALAGLRLAAAARNPMALRHDAAPRFQRVPYALAIAAGVLGALWFPELI